MKLFELQNISPKWQLTEARRGKDFHIEHLEDLIFSEGFNGVKRAFNYVETLRKMFAVGQGKIEKVKAKWDGSIDIVCGTDPIDGKFFIGGNQVFQVKEAACKSTSEIDKFYREDELLAKKLKVAYKFLSSLEIGSVLAGKLLFTADAILISNIDGKQMYTFTPNNTTYAVVVDSELGNTISQAKIGLYFHTTYEGNNLLDMIPTYDANISGIKQNKNVWLENETYKDYTGIASFTPEENARILVGLRKGASTITKLDPTKFNAIINNVDFSSYMRDFVHDKMRDREMLIDPMRLLKDFIEYYRKKHAENGEDQNNKKIEIEKFISDNLNAILGVFSIYKKLIELKILLLDKIKQIEATGVFVKDDNGYKIITSDGFVAIGHDRGIVRLVNKIEYKENL